MKIEPRYLGKYELQERLGRGGMGEVWKAFDPQLRRYVAIKVLNADLREEPDFVARFTHEAQLVASLHHPNIVQIHDFQFTETPDDAGHTVPQTASIKGPPHPSTPPSPLRSIAYMVMDYVEGTTLADYIYSTSRKGQFPSAWEFVHLFTSISLAIDYAHRQGMVHRDIKPANILLDKRNTTRNPMGEPILTDFGIAKLQGKATLAATYGLLGTPLYISPEQAQGHPSDRRSDLYSLGIIAYEIITGIPPFRGDNPLSIMMQHYSAMPTPPSAVNPHVSSALSAVILRSIAKDPNARFSSASAMTIAMAEAFNVPAPAELRLYAEPVPVDSSAHPDLPVAYSQPGSLPNDSWATARGATASQDALAQSPPLISTPAMPQRTRERRLKGWLIPVIIASIVVLIGSGLGAFYLLSQKSAPTAPPVVGQVSFSSSGQFVQDTSQGIADKLSIDLHNISSPPAGKSYYAWFLPDSNNPEGQPFVLGKVTVDHGTIHYLYPGNQQHDNLLATTSRFLITEEDASITPIVPSTDHSVWLYYAAIPEIPAASDHFSVLDHLRHLLAEDPKLALKNLHGGLDIWLLHNTRDVSQWAVNARDARQNRDIHTIRQSVVDILYYLDGRDCVQPDLQGIPAGTPATPESATIATNAGAGLLDHLCGQQQIPGYLAHIDTHLNGIMHAPGATPGQVKLTAQITTEINQVNSLLVKMRQDAQQLVKMSDAQLLQSSSQAILNDLATQAGSAYNGQNSSTGNQGQPGVQQIHDDIERLGTLDVIACQSSSGTSNACV
jgi:serine/threonine protein kinase